MIGQELALVDKLRRGLFKVCGMGEQMIVRVFLDFGQIGQSLLRLCRVWLGLSGLSMRKFCSRIATCDTDDLATSPLLKEEKSRQVLLLKRLLKCLGVQGSETAEEERREKKQERVTARFEN